MISEKIGNELKCNAQRIALPDIPTPTTFALAKQYYPTKYQICKKIFDMLGKKFNSKNNILFKSDKYSDQPFKEFMGPFWIIKLIMNSILLKIHFYQLT